MIRKYVKHQENNPTMTKTPAKVIPNINQSSTSILSKNLAGQNWAVIILAETCHAGKLITRGNSRTISIVPNIKKDVPKGWIFMVGADTDIAKPICQTHIINDYLRDHELLTPYLPALTDGIPWSAG